MGFNFVSLPRTADTVDHCWAASEFLSSATPLLDTIVTPADLRRLPEGRLAQVAEELRAETIAAVLVTGGHFGAGLGGGELTGALDHGFDTPRDRPILGGGPQAHPHKILTGRPGRLTDSRPG